MTIAEFLLARIEEDARNQDSSSLAESQLKRRILVAHGYNATGADPCHARDVEGHPIPCSTIKLMALQYAGHPDYEEEWRP